MPTCSLSWGSWTGWTSARASTTATASSRCATSASTSRRADPPAASPLALLPRRLCRLVAHAAGVAAHLAVGAEQLRPARAQLVGLGHAGASHRREGLQTVVRAAGVDDHAVVEVARP